MKPSRNHDHKDKNQIKRLNKSREKRPFKCTKL